MWLNLAKVSPELLARMRAQPGLFDTMFFEEDDELPDGFVPRTDVLGCDYLTLAEVAKAMADIEAPGTDWGDHYVWLARATGAEESDHLEEYDFGYGPAFFLSPGAVAEVLAGLTDEGWLNEDEDRDASEENEGDEFDDMTDLVPFFAAATREGKAIVGGIS